ncbi:hypothetical protein [Caballeronia sp. LZ001]|uniref:hypothetical protein n=1 Tax=Caballeronia sp. LZ001 TaxID=3038553 RepID=UPI002860548E|nr:hypothetical protein [Caballeronia sp. LZ001]MDR5799069.1 hypothetical protein [Caballeronia sp. LZ001]
MLTEEVDEYIPAEAAADLVDDDNEGGIGNLEASEVSELQRLCAEYLAGKNRSRAFVDKLARVMFADERVRKICRVRALKNGADLRDTEDVLQRVMIVFFDSQLAKLREADAVYAVIYAIANNVSREVVRDSLTLTVNHDSIEEMRDRGEELEQSSFVDSEQLDRDQQLDSQIAAAKMALAYQRHLNGEQKLNNHGVFDLDPLMASGVAAPPSTPEEDAAIDAALKNRARYAAEWCRKYEGPQRGATRAGRNLWATRHAQSGLRRIVGDRSPTALVVHLRPHRDGSGRHYGTGSQAAR